MQWFSAWILPVLCLAAAPVAAQEQDGSSHGAEPAGQVVANSHDEPVGDAHAGDHGPEYKLLTIDGMTALWTIVVFVVLLIVLRATAWKPIQKVLMERERFIADSLEQAKHHREEAEVRLKEYTAKIESARADATAIVDEGRRDAEVLKRKLEEDAQGEATAMIERAKREIGIATDTAVKELYSLSAKLATGVAEKLIQKELDEKQHQRLIQDSIEELAKAYHN